MINEDKELALYNKIKLGDMVWVEQGSSWGISEKPIKTKVVGKKEEIGKRGNRFYSIICRYGKYGFDDEYLINLVHVTKEEAEDAIRKALPAKLKERIKYNTDSIKEYSEEIEKYKKKLAKLLKEDSE